MKYLKTRFTRTDKLMYDNKYNVNFVDYPIDIFKETLQSFSSSHKLLKIYVL